MTEATPRGGARRTLPRLGAVLAVLALVAAVAAGVAAALAGFGHRWGWWPFTTGFAVLRWAVWAALAAGGAAVLGGGLLLWARRRRPLALAAPALLLAAAVAAVPASYLWTARAVPPIHDITTDTEDPPRFEAARALRGPGDNPLDYRGEALARQQRKAYPEVRPLVLDLPPGEAFGGALAVARGMGWEIVAAEAGRGRIEAVARTFWFGFEDDVVVRLESADGGTRVDVRSASRVGVSDVGANAARIRAYLGELKEAM